MARQLARGWAAALLACRVAASGTFMTEQRVAGPAFAAANTPGPGRRAQSLPRDVERSHRARGAHQVGMPAFSALRTGWWSGKIHGTGNRYSDIVREAADPNSSTFLTFRSTRSYTDIVGHNTVGSYLPYLNALCNTHEELVSERLWKSLVLIDTIGSPQRSQLAVCNGTRKLGLATGAMVRFTCTIGRILDTFGQLRVPAAVTWRPFDRWEFCEIGGGFGGMAHAVLSYSRGQVRCMLRRRNIHITANTPPHFRMPLYMSAPFFAFTATRRGTESSTCPRSPLCSGAF